MTKRHSSTVETHPDPLTNPDPITGEPGAHPVGTGVGAASGAAAGAAVGAIGGPVGAGIGAAVGAIAGGLAGHGVAEEINPTVEDAYWRDHFQARPYVKVGSYDVYRDAYRYGWESRAKYPRLAHFAEVESVLHRDWDKARGASSMAWDEARYAARDAWERFKWTEPKV